MGCTTWAGDRDSGLSSSIRASPGYHARWEAATRLLFRVILARSLPNGTDGALRHAIERIEPAQYLTSSYYERWLTAAATLAVESGIVTHAELEDRSGGPFPLSGPVTAEAITDPPPGRSRFTVGDRVRVRQWHDRIAAARAAQAEPATKALLRQRSKIERKIDHLQDLGMRTARYRGRRKTRLQALLAATVANFKRLGVLGAFDVSVPVAVAA